MAQVITALCSEIREITWRKGWSQSLSKQVYELCLRSYIVRRREKDGKLLQKETDQCWVPGKGVWFVASLQKECLVRVGILSYWEAFFGKTHITEEQAQILELAVIKQIFKKTMEQCGILSPLDVTTVLPANEHISLCCFILIEGTSDLTYPLLKQDSNQIACSHAINKVKVFEQSQISELPW